MKLLFDMNLSPKLADTLITRGIESVHWFQIGAPEATDSEIVAYAYVNDFIIVTCDLDFSIIMSISHGSKPSVVQIRVQGIPTDRVVDLIMFAIQQYTDELETGVVLTIDAKKSRMRLLPL